jgi:hypothetical protein
MIRFRFKNISRKTMGVTHFVVETNSIYFEEKFVTKGILSFAK